MVNLLFKSDQDHFASPLGRRLAVDLLELATVISMVLPFLAPYNCSLELLATPDGVPPVPPVVVPGSRDPLTWAVLCRCIRCCPAVVPLGRRLFATPISLALLPVPDGVLGLPTVVLALCKVGM